MTATVDLRPGKLDIKVSRGDTDGITLIIGFTGPASPVAVAITGRQATSTSLDVSNVLTAFGNMPAGAQVANTMTEFEGVIQTGAVAGTVALTCARAGTVPSMVIPAGASGSWVKTA